MVCLCSLQTAKCTQCSGQDRESGTWKRAVFLILGHLEWGLGTHTGSSSHGDGAPSFSIPSRGLSWPTDHAENHFSLFFCDLDDFDCFQI